MRVIVDASDVIKSFGNLELKKQDNVLKTAYYQGGRLISKGAQYGMLRTFKGRNDSVKIYSMVNSIGYKYNVRGQFLTVFPVESTDNYFSYMTKWFIAGTKNRKTYNMASRERRSGKMTVRKYKTTSRRSYGRITGNNAIEQAYNANYRMANILIQKSIERQLKKIWKNGRKSTIG